MRKPVCNKFLVWNPLRTWHPPQHVHKSYEVAKIEATRLAKENPGQEFFVLAAMGVAQVEPIPTIFTEFDIETELPF